MVQSNSDIVIKTEKSEKTDNEDDKKRKLVYHDSEIGVRLESNVSVESVKVDNGQNQLLKMYEMEIENYKREIERRDKTIFEIKSDIRLGEDDDTYKQKLIQLQQQNDSMTNKLNSKLQKQKTNVENQRQVIMEMEEEIEDLNTIINNLNAKLLKQKMTEDQKQKSEINKIKEWLYNENSNTNTNNDNDSKFILSNYMEDINRMNQQYTQNTQSVESIEDKFR